jgi:hypothetical protein
MAGTRPPRTPGFPPEQKASLAVAVVGMLAAIIPGVPPEAADNAKDIAVTVAPTLTFGGLGVRAARARWLAPVGLLARDDDGDPRTPPVPTVAYYALVAVPTVLAVAELVVIIWLLLR